MVGEQAVGRYDEREQPRLQPSGVTAAHGAAAHQDERLPHHFEDVVSGEEQEQVRERDEHKVPFVLVHLGADEAFKSACEPSHRVLAQYPLARGPRPCHPRVSRSRPAVGIANPMPIAPPVTVAHFPYTIRARSEKHSSSRRGSTPILPPDGGHMDPRCRPSARNVGRDDRTSSEVERTRSRDIGTHTADLSHLFWSGRPSRRYEMHGSGFMPGGGR